MQPKVLMTFGKLHAVPPETLGFIPLPVERGFLSFGAASFSFFTKKEKEAAIVPLSYWGVLVLYQKS